MAERPPQNELAFNARWLTTAQIAESFVPPSIFNRLTAACHSVLVGPRGSGKTTLLKMLQPSALAHWMPDENSEVKQGIKYSGVFIPADICWREQLNSLASPLPPSIGRAVSRLAVSTTILHSLVDTAIWRTGRPTASFMAAKLERDDEARLVSAVCKAWNLSVDIPSLLSLKHALTARLGALPVIAASLDSPEQRNLLVLSEATLSAPVTLFIELFNDFVRDSEGKWALLFDELEIAPEWVQDELIKSTRSIDQRILLKLSLSPYNKFIGLRAVNAAPDSFNDFDQIQLWYANRDQAGIRAEQKTFCEAMWRVALSAKRIPYVNPYIALGDSFATASDDSDEPTGVAKHRAPPAYSAEGKWGRLFSGLYSKDASFRGYIQGLGIDLSKLASMTEAQRARSVRKVAPIVAVRDFFRRPDVEADEDPGRRSRKTLELYVGAEALFALSEGHPRWLKIILSRLLESLDGVTMTRITSARQSAALQSSAHRFSALLKTYPTGDNGATTSVSILKLIQQLGRFFHGEVVQGSFKPEPYMSFTVDAATNDDVLAALQAALNLGAIVYVPDAESDVALSSLRGKRFRLSYWLAPVYGLPLVLGKSVALSSILSKTKPSDDAGTLPLPLSS